LTHKRHPVVGVLTDLSLGVPYQPNIGTETQRLKNRMKYLYVSLQCGIFSASRGNAGSSQPAYARAWHGNDGVLRHNVLLSP
jgi:hypothetical protein